VIILLVLLGIIVLGVVVGMVRRPRVRAARQLFAEQLRALAAATGWQFDSTPVPPLQLRFRSLDDVLGSTLRDGVRVTAQLVGQWRGCPCGPSSWATGRTASRSRRPSTPC
jgi:hypothetical protein